MILVLLLLLEWFLIFSASPRTAPIRKVAICGAGPAGLCLAKCLSTPNIFGEGDEQRNMLPEIIDVYETKPDARQASLGGGLQVTSGTFVLQQLGLGLQLEKASEKVKRVVARDTSGISEIFEVDVQKIVSSTSIPPCYSIMRSALQELLLDAITTSKNNSAETTTKVTINSGKKVKEAVEIKDEGKVTLKFEDDSVIGDYDMVFGSDGINTRILSSSSSIQASYSGIRVAYCITPTDIGTKSKFYKCVHCSKYRRPLLHPINHLT